MSEKLDELKKLNEKFYELFGRLYKNKTLLNNAKAYEYFGAKLFEQYKVDYELLRIKFEETEKPELYRENVKHNGLVPRRRFIFFRNRAQKLIDNEVIYELEKYFKQREEELRRNTEALERLNAALEKVDAVDDVKKTESEAYKNNRDNDKLKMKKRASHNGSTSQEKQIEGQLDISTICNS